MSNGIEIAAAVQPVVDILNKLGVSYYIGGSVASSAYGTARSTLDVDMISALKMAHVREFVAALRDRYYISEELIAVAIQRSASFNLIHLESGLKIDIFITKNRPYDQAAGKRVRLDTISDTDGAAKFLLASPEDIILAKLEWFKRGGQTSERQWQDILGVLRVQKNNLDESYLRAWAERLGVAELMLKALAER